MAGSASGSAQRLGDQRALLVRRRAGDGEGEVGPVEAGGHLQRLAQPEPAGDVDRHPRRGRGGGGHDRGRAQVARGVGEAEVVGPEVVPPLRHAVRLVDHEQPDPGLAHAARRSRARRTARAPRRAAAAPRRPRASSTSALAPESCCALTSADPIAQPARPQRLDLVLHQRHQRRDHDREVVAHQRRQLVAERLARAGGHDHQHVAIRRAPPRTPRAGRGGRPPKPKMALQVAVEVHPADSTAVHGGSPAAGGRP